MPIKHSPFTILAIRLMTYWLAGQLNCPCSMNLQDEVKNNNYSISTEKSDHVKEVELRVPSWRLRASNDMLVTVRPIFFCLQTIRMISLTAFSTRKT